MLFIDDTEIASVARHGLLENTPNSLPLPVPSGLTESPTLYLFSPSKSHPLICGHRLG